LRALILAAIEAYWRVPVRRRGRCIFTETCSRHVYRVTESDGARAGIRAFFARARQCRPGYRVFFAPDGSLAARLADGTVVPASDLRVAVEFTVDGVSADLATPSAIPPARREA
jgi:putative component of membrane protein insertase Oxa1/YidC/SpoIIIJ protein YidD